MKKLFGLIVLFCSLSTFSNAQLAAGDIAFIGMNTDATEGYSIITLTDIPGSKVIFFSDRGIISSGAYITGTEGTYKFTAPASGISCGTIISFTEDSPDVYTITGVSGATMVLEAGLANLGTGDQVYAYTTPTDVISAVPSDATFLAGIMCDYDAVCVDATTKWTQGACVSSTSECIVPPGLANTISCLSMTPAGPEIDNMRYTGTLTGTSTALRASINNYINWETNNSPTYTITPAGYASPSVTCVAACTDPDIPTVTATTNLICNGGSTTLNISGSLNDATQWHIYTGSCGVTSIGTTAGSTFTVSPTSTTSYFIRGEGGCTTPGICGAISITVNPADDASFSYSASAYCVDATDPTPTITGLAGGAFSSTAGLSLNAGSGAVDVSASTPGTYTVTYTTAGSCPNSSNVNVTINALDDASFNYSAASYCANDTDPTPTITGLAGGAFSSTAGLSINASTGAIDLSASTPGAYTVTYTTTGICPNSSNVSVTISTPPAAPSVVTPLNVCPGSDVILSATGSGSGSLGFYNSVPTLLGTVPMPPATATFNVGGLSNGMYTFGATELVGACESLPTVINVNVSDLVPPTAVCQDISIFLDGSGNASLVAADIDGGSTDNCGTVSLSASQTTFDCSNIFGAPASNLVITGAYDGPLTGGTPKGVELFVLANIADLSQYGLGSANNGGGTDGEEFTFPAVPATAGTFIYVSSESTQFTNFFGFAPDYTTGAMSINGDDAVELFFNGGVIDVFGDINVDGTGQPWDYLDGWASRNTGTGPDGSSFQLGNWSFSGINVFDGQTTNATSPTPMPIAAYAYVAAPGPTPVTLTVTDGSGNTSTCIASVTVSDTVSPVVTCPGLQTETPDASCNFTLPDYTGLVTATDNCGVPTLVQSPVAGTVISGTTTITMTSTDANGNISACTFDVTLNDVTPPTAVCQNISVFLDGSGNASIVAADIDGGSTDNCAGLTLSASVTAFTCANLGPNNVTLTATDGNTNTANCVAVVTVLDTISPVATCPGDQTETASAICDLILPDYTSLVSATDNCGGAPVITQSPVAGTLITADQVITMTVDDGNGNTSTCTFNVILDVSGCAGTECANAIAVGPHDPCGDQTSVTGSTTGGTPSTEAFCGTSLGSGGANWYTFIGDGSTWTASTVSGLTNYDTKIWVYEGACAALNCVTGNDDFVGVQSQASFMTTVGATYYVVVGGFSSNEGNYELVLTSVEAIAPVPDLATLADLTAECTMNSLTDPTATDNCSAIVTVTNDATLPITAQGTTVVTWTYDDGNGNTSTQTQNVILNDVTPPVGDSPTLADVTAECEVTALIDPTATDNCAGTVLVTNNAILPITAQGTTVVTWTYDDGNGNTSTQTQNVILNDVTPPVGDSPTLADVTAECEVTALIDPTATDNCAGTVLVTNNAILPITAQGTTVVTWTYDDGNGNTSTQTQNVILTDVTLPTASNPDTAYYECPGDAIIDETVVNDEADNCTGAVLVTFVSDTIYGNGCLDTIARTYNVADQTGNNIDVVQIIIIEDVTAPVASNPSAINVQCIGDVPAPAVGWVAGEVDNCTAVPTVAWESDVSDGLSCPETITRTYSITDDCGNQTLVDQLIVVKDFDAPIADITLLTEVTANCDVTPANATATDNCNGAVTGVPDVVFPITALGTTTVTWTYTDACGNTSSQTQDVTINPPIDVSTTLGGDDLTMLANNTNPGVTYQWMDCDTGLDIAGETSQAFLPTNGGNYAVIITENGCVDTSACVLSTVGIEDLTLNSLLVYPNPSSNGYFTVSYEGTIQAIDVVDMLGRVIVLPTDLASGIVDGSELAQGRYMVRVTTEKTVLTTDIVIAR